MTEEQIEKEAGQRYPLSGSTEWASRDDDCNDAFIEGAKFALEHQWKSVTEKPRHNQLVIIMALGYYTGAYYHETEDSFFLYDIEFHDQFNSNNFKINDVEYWMPIPKYTKRLEP